MTASERLFGQSLSSDSSVRGVDDIASIAHLALQKCDSGKNINIYSNIVGNMLMRDSTESFDYENRKLTEQHARTDIDVSAAPHRMLEKKQKMTLV
jgi:hypothetical protein